MCVLSGGGEGESLVILIFFIPIVLLTDLFLVSPSCSPPSLVISSWTEDTRSRIFSDTALHLGKDGQSPLAAELDMQIEEKFEEFDELVATGQSILGKEHHLTQMVSGFTCKAHDHPSLLFVPLPYKVVRYR